MLSYRNARSVAAVCALLVTCFVGTASASEPAPKAASAPASLAAPAANAPERARARDQQETVISTEHAKEAAPVPEPTGLLMSCLLGGVLLAIGQQLRSWRRAQA